MIKLIDAGELRSNLVLQTSSVTKVGIDSVTNWTDVATIWAKVSPLNSREAFYASQIQASTTHNIICRYDDRITPKARFKMGDRIFAIDGVRDLEERRTYMVVSAIEQQD